MAARQLRGASSYVIGLRVIGGSGQSRGKSASATIIDAANEPPSRVAPLRRRADGAKRIWRPCRTSPRVGLARSSAAARGDAAGTLERGRDGARRTVDRRRSGGRASDLDRLIDREPRAPSGAGRASSDRDSAGWTRDGGQLQPLRRPRTRGPASHSIPRRGPARRRGEAAIGNLQETLGRLDMKVRLAPVIAASSRLAGDVARSARACHRATRARTRRSVADHDALFARFTLRGRAGTSHGCAHPDDRQRRPDCSGS